MKRKKAKTKIPKKNMVPRSAHYDFTIIRDVPNARLHYIHDIIRYAMRQVSLCYIILSYYYVPVLYCYSRVCNYFYMILLLFNSYRVQDRTCARDLHI